MCIRDRFIDSSAAYAGINRAKLFTTMNEFGIPGKLTTLFMNALEGSQCRVKVQTDLSEPLQITNGLRQGYSLSCLLSNISLVKVVRDAGIQTRATIFFKSIQLLTYVDVIDIMGRSPNDGNKAFTAL